ncbi:MAG: right-handed parallel beta-helix repeat-containing protein [Deltaproteobacteria bacterium]|nr:right-handed parallel beta-helix repeat-containing protein [Deltaproteobacteria bacterium]
MQLHRLRSRVVCLVLGLVALAPAARAATRHVAPTGDDTNPGTESAPWATLQHAADEVAPGDEVLVADGDYVTVVVTTSGTEAAPIVFRATGEAANVGPEVPDGDGIVVRASWVTFDGFHVASTGQHGVTVGPAAPGGVVEGVRLVGLAITGCVGDGLHLGRTVRATVEGCVVHDVDGTGIALVGSAGALVQNNAVWGGLGDGIVVAHDPGLTLPTEAAVVNNSVLRTGTAGWALRFEVEAGQSMAGNVAFNNVLLVADDAAGSLALGEGDAGLASARNAVSDRFGNGTATLTLAEFQALGYEASSVQTEPLRLFRDTLGGDLRLRAGCPAVNMGLADFEGRSAPDHDLLGVRRPVGATCDIGAYEFCIGDDCTGETPDAGTDTGGDTGTDAAADTGGGDDDGGCGCRTTGRPVGPGTLLLLGALTPALAVRRRRVS